MDATDIVGDTFGQFKVLEYLGVQGQHHNYKVMGSNGSVYRRRRSQLLKNKRSRLAPRPRIMDDEERKVAQLIRSAW